MGHRFTGLEQQFGDLRREMLGFITAERTGVSLGRHLNQTVEVRYTSGAGPAPHMTNSEYQQLVEFLGRQFAEVDGRFTQVDGRFAQVDARFALLDQRLLRFDECFQTIDQQFGTMDRRLVTMEQRFEAGFDAVEQQLRDILGHLDAIYGRLERLEQEYHAITQGLRRIELLLADERTKREILARGVLELKQRIAGLQARVDELERRIRE
jgi:chromosome segregation ATPase